MTRAGRFTVTAALLLLTPARFARGLECLSHPRINLQRLAGQVFWPLGQEGSNLPAANVQIIVQRRGGKEEWPAPVSMTTDATGAFDFEGLDAGLYSVTIRHPPDGADSYVAPTGMGRFDLAVVKRADWRSRRLYASLGACAKLCVTDGAGTLLARGPDCLQADTEVVPDDREQPRPKRRE